MSLDLSPSLSMLFIYFGVLSSTLSSVSDCSRPRLFRLFGSRTDLRKVSAIEMRISEPFVSFLFCWLRLQAVVPVFVGPVRS